MMPRRLSSLSTRSGRGASGSDPAVIGKMMTLNGHRFTVVGVAPAGFASLVIGSSPDLWIPLAMNRAINPQLDRNDRHLHWLLGVGRLKSGVTPAQAQADFAILARQLSQAYPDTDRELDARGGSCRIRPDPVSAMPLEVSALA